MLYIDYNWDLYPDKIVLDEEINTDKLGWKGGDFFRFVNINGKQMLVKVTDIEKFLLDGATKNEQIPRLVGQSRSTDSEVLRETTPLAR